MKKLLEVLQIVNCTVFGIVSIITMVALFWVDSIRITLGGHAMCCAGLDVAFALFWVMIVNASVSIAIAFKLSVTE